MGVGRSGRKASKGSCARSGLRASPRPPPSLPRRRDWRGDLPTTVPAASPGIRLREGRQGEGAGARSASLATGLGPAPPADPLRLREHVKDRDPPGDASARILVPPPRGEAEGDSRRTGEAGGVHGVHRTHYSDLSGRLPDVGRLDRLGGAGERPTGPCPICGRWGELTLDHILPRKFGGTDSPPNLRWICRPCNSVKGGRLVTDHALRWYRWAQNIARQIGVGVDPPALGCVGPEPVLSRLLEFSLWRARPPDE